MTEPTKLTIEEQKGRSNVLKGIKEFINYVVFSVLNFFSYPTWDLETEGVVDTILKLNRLGKEKYLFFHRKWTLMRLPEKDEIILTWKYFKDLRYGPMKKLLHLILFSMERFPLIYVLLGELYMLQIEKKLKETEYKMVVRK